MVQWKQLKKAGETPLYFGGSAQFAATKLEVALILMEITVFGLFIVAKVVQFYFLTILNLTYLKFVKGDVMKNLEKQAITVRLHPEVVQKMDIFRKQKLWNRGRFIEEATKMLVENYHSELAKQRV